MTVCTWCKKDFTPICACPTCGHDNGSAITAVKDCPKVCAATIYVQDSAKGAGVENVKALLDGGGGPSDGHGFRTFKDLPPGEHAASISLEGLEDKFSFPIGHADAPVKKTIAADQTEFFNFTVDPLTALKVTVKRLNDRNGLKDAKVKLTPKTAGNAPAKVEDTTPVGGEVTFGRLRRDTYQIDVALDDTLKSKFELVEPQVAHALDMAKNPDEHVFWAKLVVHLRLKYKDPDDTERFFPRDFPVKVAFDDNSTVDLKVLDDKGYVKFPVSDHLKTKFTLKFDSPAVRFLVHADGEKLATVKENPSEADLQKMTTDKQRFFALPKQWTLAQSAWQGTGVAVPDDGQIVVPADGLGSEDVPAELMLLPRCQYLRFEFFDRKYGVSDHGNSRVSIPAIVLKGVRESDAAGAGVNPLAGTHDAISNWMVDKDSASAACQSLPWVITRGIDGNPLPKLNNKAMFEFGWTDAFVHSVSATDRKILVLPGGDERRKPTRDRNRYYDLPKLWKSKCYYTRFSDPAKNRCFDELLAADDPELEASHAKGTRLVFSLDDVVLTSGASQAVTDKLTAGGATPLSEHSRVAILLLDDADKFKVKVYKPRAEAAYWSESGFLKEAAAATRRNLLVDVPGNPRAVVFCDGFHDIYDKRTESADFGLKGVLGARAAKLEDTEISSRKALFDQNAAVTSHYVHLTRKFHMHYLHYGGTDGTTVYGALVTMWTCRFKKDVAKGGTDDMIKTYREEGMARAMARWNERDYTFEEANDKKDVVVKQFCLFEAKGVETAPGTFYDAGGPHICMVTVKDDDHGGSSAAVDGLTMVMRQSGAIDEGDGWGPISATNPLSAVAEHGGAASPSSAFAHELGHAAIGLFDDYITGKLSYPLDASGDAIPGQTANTKLPTYTGNDVLLDRHGQRCFGMPYALDESPLMKTNRTVRLRYYWGRANWLNDEAKGALSALLSSKRFRVVSAPAGGAKMKFSKPAGPGAAAGSEQTLAGFESIYKPKAAAVNYALGNASLCNLHLYHLGEDEFSVSYQGGPYNGVLALSLKISASFRAYPTYSGNHAYKTGDVVKRGSQYYQCTADHTSGLLAGLGSGAPDTGKWVVATMQGLYRQQVNHVVDLDGRINTMLASKFKLQGNGHFSTTLLRIFPQWEIVASVGDASADSHFKIEFVYGSSEFTPSGTTIVAGTACNPKAIIRYMLGKIGAVSSQWPSQGGLDADLTKDDFPALKSWMDTNAPGRFNVGAI